MFLQWQVPLLRQPVDSVMSCDVSLNTNSGVRVTGCCNLLELTTNEAHVPNYYVTYYICRNPCPYRAACIHCLRAALVSIAVNRRNVLWM